MPTASISSMNTMHWPPHLRASRRALEIRNMTTTTSMPMNVWREARAGHGHERRVERSSRSPWRASSCRCPARRGRAGRARACRRDFSNSSPDCHREITRVTSSLGSAWPRTSVELDAPVRVARLVALHLLDAEEQQRPEEDEEVERGRTAAAAASGSASAAGTARTAARTRSSVFAMPPGSSPAMRRNRLRTTVISDEDQEQPQSAGGSAVRQYQTRRRSTTSCSSISWPAP